MFAKTKTKWTNIFLHFVRKKSTASHFCTTLYNKDMATKVCLIFLKKKSFSNKLMFWQNKKVFFLLWQSLTFKRSNWGILFLLEYWWFQYICSHNTLTKQRGLVAYERAVILLDIYFQEIQFEMSAISFFKIAYLSIHTSICDPIPSIEPRFNWKSKHILYQCLFH